MTPVSLFKSLLCPLAVRIPVSDTEIPCEFSFARKAIKFLLPFSQNLVPVTGSHQGQGLSFCINTVRSRRDYHLGLRAPAREVAINSRAAQQRHSLCRMREADFQVVWTVPRQGIGQPTSKGSNYCQAWRKPEGHPWERSLFVPKAPEKLLL